MGKFEMSQRSNRDYQFNLKAGNGQIILTSQGYSSKAACEQGINSVRVNAQSDAAFDRLIAKNEKHYFNIRASNGQIIGSSQMYESKDGMEKGILSVKENAGTAEVKEIIS